MKPALSVLGAFVLSFSLAFVVQVPVHAEGSLPRVTKPKLFKRLLNPPPIPAPAKVMAPARHVAHHPHGAPTMVGDSYVPFRQISPAIPDLCSTASATHVADTTGNFDDVNTWVSGTVPGTDSRISVNSGVTVTYNVDNTATPADCLSVESGGLWTVSTGVATKFKVTNLIVRSGGEYRIGSSGSRISFANSHEIITRDIAPDAGTCCPATGTDPEQYGTGIISFGTFHAFGTIVTPFMRLAEDMSVGEDIATLVGTPVGWASGHEYRLADTRTWNGVNTTDNGGYTWQGESGTIASVNGSDVTFNAGMTYAHTAPIDFQGNVETGMRAHVMHLSRSIVIRSENPSGSRGHFMATGQADIHIEYTRFENYGRTTEQPLDCTIGTTGGQSGSLFPGICNFGEGDVTEIGTNQIGRYALHLHHLRGPATPPANGFQFTLVGLAIDKCTKWCLAVHNSHYGHIDESVFFDGKGALVMFEDGSETENLIEDSIACKGTGPGGRDAGGREGSGYYFRGSNSRIRNVVACNILNPSNDSAYGVKWFQSVGGAGSLTSVRIPNAPGVDTTDDDEVTIHNPAQDIPIREADGIEVYGATESCITYWWIGSVNNDPIAHMRVSRIENVTCWRFSSLLLFNYPGAYMHLENWTARCEVWSDGYPNGGGLLSDYLGHGSYLVNWNIQRCWTGLGSSMKTRAINGQADQVIEGGFFANYRADIWWFAQQTSDGDATTDTYPRRTIVRNVTFGTMTSGVHAEHTNLWTYFTPDSGNNQINRTVRDELYVFNWGGDPDADFEVFMQEQDPAAIIAATDYQDEPLPVTAVRRAGCQSPDGPDPDNLPDPVAGLTNQECFDLYGLTTLGKLATCDDEDTYPGVEGFACPFTGENGLPPFAMADYDFTQLIGGDTIQNTITIERPLPNLIVDANSPDVAVGGDGYLVWNLNIPNPVQTYPFDPTRGSFARTEVDFPNTFRRGTIGVRVKTTTQQLDDLNVASGIGFDTWRPSPDTPGIESYPPRAISYYRDGPGTLKLFSQDGHPIGCQTGCTQQDYMTDEDVMAEATDYLNIIVTWTDGRMNMFVDGVQVDSIAQWARLVGEYRTPDFHLYAAVQPSLIHSGDNPFLIGSIARYIVYDRELDADEVAELNAEMDGALVDPPLTVNVDVQPVRATYTVTADPPDMTGGWTFQPKRDGVNIGGPDSSAPYSVQATLDATETYPVTGLWTKPGEADVTVGPLSFAACVTNRSEGNATLAVACVITRCEVTIEAWPPDTSTGWDGTIFRAKTIKFGTKDATADTKAVRSEILALGTHSITVLWQKSGETDVPTTPVNATCSGG